MTHAQSDSLIPSAFADIVGEPGPATTPADLQRERRHLAAILDWSGRNIEFYEKRAAAAVDSAHNAQWRERASQFVVLSKYLRETQMALSKLAADLTAAIELITALQAANGTLTGSNATLTTQLAAAQAAAVPADVAAAQAAFEALPAVQTQLAADAAAVTPAAPAATPA